MISILSVSVNCRFLKIQVQFFQYRKFQYSEKQKRTQEENPKKWKFFCRNSKHKVPHGQKSAI